VRFLLSFSILFVLWVIWSGKFDLFHLVLGVIATSIVAVWSGDLLVQDQRVSLGHRVRMFFRFEWYSLWLVYEILLANFHVIYVALHPNMKRMLDPKMVSFKSKLKGEMPQFILAQSITLTPGTVTVRANDGEFLIHALTAKVAKDLPGDMEARVARIFE